MNKEEIQNTTYVGKIVDMPLEEFKTYCNEDDKDMGVIKGLEKMLTVVFNNLSDARNKVMDKIKSNAPQGLIVVDKQKLLFEIFTKMQVVETKIFVLREIQKDRNAQVEDNFKKLKSDS